MKLESLLERAHLHQSYFTQYPTSILNKTDKQKIFPQNNKQIRPLEININPYYWYYREDIIDENKKIVDKNTRKISLSSMGHSEVPKLPSLTQKREKNLTSLSNYNQNMTPSLTRDKSNSKLALQSLEEQPKDKKIEKKKKIKPRERLKGTSELPVQNILKNEIPTPVRNEETQALSKLRRGLTSGKLRYLAVSEKFIPDARNMIYNPTTQSFLPKLKQQYLKNIIIN